MRERKQIIPFLASLLLLSGCTLTPRASSFKGNAFDFEDVTGVDISDIKDMKVSASVAMSAAWTYNDYSFLDTDYDRVEFSIYDAFFGYPKEEGDDDAICLHITTYIVLETYPTQDYAFTMYISHSTHYIYYGSSMEGAYGAYRSRNPISEELFKTLLGSRPTAAQYTLTVQGGTNVSPDLPKSGTYDENQKISFKIEIVTDATFHAYLNNELLKPIRDDETLGGYAYYEFNMPGQNSTLVITDDGFYLDKPYSFEEVFPWVSRLSKQTLKGITIEDGYIGVNPATANPTVRYSEDERDIDYNLSILQNDPLIKIEDAGIAGGTYRIATYLLHDGSQYSIQMSNGRVLYEAFGYCQYFRFDTTPTRVPDVNYPIS